MVLKAETSATAQHSWWGGGYMQRSEPLTLGARMGACRGTSAALLTIAMGHWAEENVSGPSL